MLESYCSVLISKFPAQNRLVFGTLNSIPDVNLLAKANKVQAVITDKTLTFATANLFNFIEPPGAFYDFENIYERDAWQEKCRWTLDQIKQLDADIIGLQEVFSIEAAKTLLADIGYQYFATVDHPHIESDYIYSKPVVALASRYPISKVFAATPPTFIEHSYLTQIPEFSRKPLCTVVDVPDIGEVAVYVCHLKSQRPTDSSDADNAHLLVGRWLSSQQRGWEAVMLRLFIEQQYKQHPIPTVLMGDMNQPLDSDITGLLTSKVDQNNERLHLQDSWFIYQDAVKKTLTDFNELSSEQSSEQDLPTLERAPTHYHLAKGNVLDYILLSQEFQQDSPYSLADVSDYKVLNSHLINPIYVNDKQASDHAFVAITVRFVL
ncbi:hypothetical protein VSF3289_01720 [Vibrio scophthalmi]|uniref:Endonuclease/exonuclease/phosphatase domain-containing protein n=1 Tax=Vibrio scophthalmi TaxID=45658 RepID=A0A1E3WNW1_9VIBR|nr:hypothetical protein VSF3289_01720 [Vibrio scophthalmi]